jgi:hypothetical protein
MTPERVLDVVNTYEKRFAQHGVTPLCIRETVVSPDPTPYNREVRHLAWMLGEIRTQVAAGEIEKAMRWLGFLQGALWTYGWYTLDEMRDHNR